MSPLSAHGLSHDPSSPLRIAFRPALPHAWGVLFLIRDSYSYHSAVPSRLQKSVVSRTTLKRQILYVIPRFNHPFVCHFQHIPLSTNLLVEIIYLSDEFLLKHVLLREIFRNTWITLVRSIGCFPSLDHVAELFLQHFERRLARSRPQLAWQLRHNPS